jgi:phosphate transport system regulatory protein PhoU
MIGHLFGVLDVGLAIEFTVKILLALLLGGIVGFERERRHMPAGLRTFMLVSVGSCIFTLISYHGFTGGDPARVAAQIVSGIGFLGAGVTIQRKGTIYGLTSAAGIWAVAAIGMAVGTGKYFIAFVSTAAIFTVLGLLRRWFKADVTRATRRTLNTALRDVRGQIATMGNLVEQAILKAVQAAVGDDHDLAAKVIQEDERINELRYRVEQECLDILRTQHPANIQLRTVLAATQIATNLERMGDYAKEIAQVRLKMGHDPLPSPADQVPALAQEVTTLLQQVLIAFAEDDVAAAQKIADQASAVDKKYQGLAESVTETMSEKKTRRFERGAFLLDIAYYLKRTGERVTNIAERIVFVRTGSLAEIDLDE